MISVDHIGAVEPPAMPTYASTYASRLNEVGRADTYRQIAAWLAARWKESRAA